MNTNDYENNQLEEEYQPSKEPECDGDLLVEDEPLSERIHDDGNGLDYVLIDNWYYLPDLGTNDVADDYRPNIWARRHLRFIKSHRRTLYSELLTSGNLTEHLCEIDQSAEAMYGRLVAQFSEREGLTEELKATDQMAWVQLANSIRSRAAEAVNCDLIYN